MLTVRTRSVLGTMAYLSYGVVVPPTDLASGAAASSPFDGTVSPPIRVLSSEEPPVGAALAVEHRGHWFYIEDPDLESRRTFGALNSLVRLEIGAGGAQLTPVLTLPVAR